MGFPRDLLAVALFSAGLACADPSTACSMSSGYKVPTNLQLAAKADTIVIAVVEGERTSSQLWSGSIIARPLVLIKGSALPESVEIQGATIANNPQMLSMVVPSAPRELRAPNPGALMGACVRYVFSKGMNLVLFLKRDKSGNLIPYRSAFSRDAEDVVDENALWAKAVREYASISVAPQQQWRTLLRNRITTLRANAADPDAQAIANDMVVELSAKRQPPYD